MRVAALERRNVAPKPGYKQPGRKGLVAIVAWVTPAERDALKVATIAQGTSTQDVLAAAARTYIEKRAHRSPGHSSRKKNG
jgi:hypothetical protein